MWCWFFFFKSLVRIQLAWAVAHPAWHPCIVSWCHGATTRWPSTSFKSLFWKNVLNARTSQAPVHELRIGDEGKWARAHVFFKRPVCIPGHVHGCVGMSRCRNRWRFVWSKDLLICFTCKSEVMFVSSSPAGFHGRWPRRTCCSALCAWGDSLHIIHVHALVTASAACAEIALRLHKPSNFWKARRRRPLIAQSSTYFLFGYKRRIWSG